MASPFLVALRWEVRSTLRVVSPQPKISCLMVTSRRPKLVLRAIACYLAQTYPCKELVIVEHGDPDDDGLKQRLAALGRADIVHVRVPLNATVKLGDLRNISLAASSGEYVVQWDDDDWHSAQRLQLQYDALQGADVCFLQRLILA